MIMIFPFKVFCGMLEYCTLDSFPTTGLLVLCRHSYFLKMVSGCESSPWKEGVIVKKAEVARSLNQVRDLPVFRESDQLSFELQ